MHNLNLAYLSSETGLAFASFKESTDFLCVTPSLLVKHLQKIILHKFCILFLPILLPPSSSARQ